MNVGARFCALFSSVIPPASSGQALTHCGLSSGALAKEEGAVLSSREENRDASPSLRTMASKSVGQLGPERGLARASALAYSNHESANTP